MGAPSARRARILLLFSGGLDSLLAARLLKEAGGLLEAVHFITPFTGSEDSLPGERYMNQWKIPIRRIRIPFDEYKFLLEHPPHGFGRALNPCIDCKIMFMRKAAEILQEEGFDAIASGEVVGERPMSQNRQSLDTIRSDSKLQGILLRPLSALLLPQTTVEEKGLIDRGKLLGIQGRGRKPQLELARRWEIEEYATPAGGCLLTEPNYCSKLRDLLAHPAQSSEETVALLKTGRHFRYSAGPKLIVGRNQQENETLLTHGSASRIFLEVRGPGSPTGLLFSPDPDTAILGWAASIVARYSDAEKTPLVEVTWWIEHQAEHILEVVPARDQDISSWRL